MAPVAPDWARWLPCVWIAGCSSAAAARPAPSASELNALADIEERSATTAPTSDAQSLRDAAHEHRRQAQSITDRAQQLCVNVSAADRAHPSMLSAGAVEGVRPSYVEHRLIKSSVPELRGAEFLVSPAAGLTRSWIAHVVRCHAAWLEVIGTRASDVRDDPFAVAGDLDITFDETDSAFVVRVRGRDKTEGEDILRRALRFASASTR